MWVGAVDDLWSFGRPVGEGGPWKGTAVKAGVASEPYLMTGYERKTLRLSQAGTQPVSVKVEVDLSGNGTWVTYRSFTVTTAQPVEHVFPDGYQAYWVRVTASADTTATAWFVYE